MESIRNIFEKITTFFRENPQYAKLILPLFGVLLLVGAICNWEWLFENDGRVFNLAWVKYNISETFARILVGGIGVLLIILGVILYFTT